MSQDAQQLSRQLSAKIRAQRKEIADNNRYLREQEEIINKTINEGNNRLLQLNKEVDETSIFVQQARSDLIKVTKQIDDKRFELLSLQ